MFVLNESLKRIYLKSGIVRNEGLQLLRSQFHQFHVWIPWANVEPKQNSFTFFSTFPKSVNIFM